MKNIKLHVLIFVFSVILMSCVTQKQSTGYRYEAKTQQVNSNLFEGGKTTSDSETIERKILFSTNLSLAVEIPDTANFLIEQIAKKYHGYVNEIGTYKTIIRVKSKHFEDAISEISALGKVQHKNMTGEDVTEEYLDYQIRLENAEKARQRYLELLKKAENVEATLKVEKELERLNEIIDLLKGRMNRIEHLSEFSTITIHLKERNKPGVLGYVGIGLYHSVKWLFVRN